MTKDLAGSEVRLGVVFVDTACGTRLPPPEHSRIGLRRRAA